MGVGTSTPEGSPEAPERGPLALVEFLKDLPYAVETQACEPLVELARRLGGYLGSEAQPDPVWARARALRGCRNRVMHRIMDRVQGLLTLPGESLPRALPDAPSRLTGEAHHLAEFRELLRRELEDAVERAVVIAGLWEWSQRGGESPPKG